MYLKNKWNPTTKRKRSASNESDRLVKDETAHTHYGKKSFNLQCFSQLEFTNIITTAVFILYITDHLFLWLAIPVTVDGPLKELHGIFRLSELPVGWVDLSPHAADAGVVLKRVGPPLRFLIHHLQQVPPILLRCGQLLDRGQRSWN